MQILRVEKRGNGSHYYNLEIVFLLFKSFRRKVWHLSPPSSMAFSSPNSIVLLYGHHPLLTRSSDSHISSINHNSVWWIKCSVDPGQLHRKLHRSGTRSSVVACISVTRSYHKNKKGTLPKIICYFSNTDISNTFRDKHFVATVKCDSYGCRENVEKLINIVSI